MSAQANVRQSGPVSIVDLCGDITLGPGFELVRGATKELMNAGQKNILLNLRGVSNLDSAGLGALVSCYATSSNLGGSLKLVVSPQSDVSELLQLTKLNTLFVIFSDEDEALRSFAAAAGGRLFL